MKLKWSRDAGGSKRQLRDARRVYELQRVRLDIAYVEQWVRDLHLTDDWNRLLADADPVQ